MKKIAALLALAVALAVPAFAGPVIYSGIDVWRTPGQGESFSDFASQPLPAGFLCEGAAPFTGRVEYKGLPIATDRAGALGQTDTIIHRLDDAEINARGVASTRLQVRALNLVSRAPIQTDCGAYNLRVSLDGRQPTTLMRIFRDGDEGGRFLAPLALRVKLTFTPVEGGEVRELRRLVRFNSDPRFTWSMDESKRSIRQSGWIKVDTDGDNTPDTFVPGTSNFVPGMNGEKAECSSSFLMHDTPDGHGVC